MMWTDEQYRKFIKAESCLIDDYASFLSNQNRHDPDLKRLVWLRLMGLMETWRIT